MQITKKLSLQKLTEITLKEIRTAALFVHATAKSKGMQFTDIRCIDHLVNVHSATAGELAKITDLTTGATTAMIDRLEKEKLVKRKLDPTDRRKIIVTFTGKKYHSNKNENTFFTKNIPSLLSTYTPKEQELITNWNMKMTTLLQDEINKLNDTETK